MPFVIPTPQSADALAVGWIDLCTPGMGVNLWGASPLCVNRIGAPMGPIETLADGKGSFARGCLKEARVQNCEPTNRNVI